jgi:hypothetical protein
MRTGEFVATEMKPMAQVAARNGGRVVSFHLYRRALITLWWLIAKSAIDPEEIDALIERLFHVINREFGQRLLPPWSAAAQTTLLAAAGCAPVTCSK